MNASEVYYVSGREKCARGKVDVFNKMKMFSFFRCGSVCKVKCFLEIFTSEPFVMIYQERRLTNSECFIVN